MPGQTISKTPSRPDRAVRKGGSGTSSAVGNVEEVVDPLLTPEHSIRLQNSTGSDIIMQLLDELVTKSPGRVPRRCRKPPPHDFERSIRRR
ncbi:hypothetical protein QBC47DRAFT_403546 [Echria macrotheca]|uniref:Uncharacterized protein n=1 Tax=Echria macrotheca TaxID=438768 RepID=A0AAJ0B9H2_9PEZI|nr:hypothetical protein QBC47DRAFT_403546 [Echria macrotheca]